MTHVMWNSKKHQETMFINILSFQSWRFVSLLTPITQFKSYNVLHMKSIWRMNIHDAGHSAQRVLCVAQEASDIFLQMSMLNSVGLATGILTSMMFQQNLCRGILKWWTATCIHLPFTTNLIAPFVKVYIDFILVNIYHIYIYLYNMYHAHTCYQHCIYCMSCELYIV